MSLSARGSSAGSRASSAPSPRYRVAHGSGAVRRPARASGAGGAASDSLPGGTACPALARRRTSACLTAPAARCPRRSGRCRGRRRCAVRAARVRQPVRRGARGRPPAAASAGAGARGGAAEGPAARRARIRPARTRAPFSRLGHRVAWRPRRKFGRPWSRSPRRPALARRPARADRSTTPSWKISISIAPLLVSRRPRRCRRAGRGRRACTSHSTSVPASMSAPSDGMRNSAIGQPASAVRAPPRRSSSTCGSAASSRCPAYGIGTSARADAADRRVQVVEGAPP